jgi:hypothetical protein
MIEVRGLAQMRRLGTSLGNIPLTSTAASIFIPAHAGASWVQIQIPALMLDT